jgi:phosphate-selective porin OprO/OprP
MIGGLRGNSRILLAGSSAVAILAFGVPAAKADSIEEQLKAMQAQIEALKREVQLAKAAAAASSTKNDDLDLKVKWKGAPEFSSEDGKFKFKVRGRVQADYSSIDQDFDITEEGDINAVEIRRARLGVEGVVFYDWKYKFEVDFAGNESIIRDAYVAYANWWKSIELSEIRAGNYYVYTSLEQVTSSRFITFMERAAFVDAFFPSVEGDRQIGAGILVGDEHWSFQTGIYGASTGEGNEIPGQEEFDDDKLTYSVRGTIAPINREVNGVNQVVHFGASYRHRDAGTLNACAARDPDTGNGSACFDSFDDDVGSALYQYRTVAADLHLADRLIDTPQFSDADDLWHLEAAFVWGPFSMQGEYAQLEANGVGFDVSELDDDPPPAAVTSVDPVNPTYTGWYVDASLYLTGETRTYEADTGEFGRPKVKRPFYVGSGPFWNGVGGGWGAWQIAVRYDVLDLSDKAAAMGAAYDCSECGEQETWLFGVNWWWTDYTLLKLNVNYSEITGGNAGFAPGDGFNQNNGAEVWGVGMRAQVDW